jgi:nucleoside-diphosphate-sugar epimerase/glycosyltransferase involved in cell wall biosynthesis
MSKILITGGAGFIGSHLAKKLSENNKVIVLQRDIVPNLWLAEALDKCILVHGDILDQSLLRRIISDYSIDQIYHLAAQAVVCAANKDPYTTFNVNVMGTVNLLEAVRTVKPNIPVLVQSTDKVMGNNRMDMKETDAMAPTIGVYEVSKACQDYIAQMYANQYGLDIKISRPCNTYGYDLASRIISNTIRSCLNKNPPIIYDGQEKTIRQYIYVDDLVEALLLIMKQPRTEEAQVFNVGTDDILTQEQLVKTIAESFSLNIRVVKRTTPLKEIEKQSVDWTKLKALGWKPKYNFQAGLAKTIKEFQTYGFEIDAAENIIGPKVEVTPEEHAENIKKVNKLIEDYHESQKTQLAKHPSQKIIYCQATYSNDFEDTMNCVERVSPYVDATIIVEPGDISEIQKVALRCYGCIVKTYTFSDNLPAMRNEYLEEAKKIDPYAWIVVSDPDELISENTCKNLREIVKAAEANGNNMIGLNAHDIWIGKETMDQGIAQKEAPYKESDFWKYLIFKIAPDFRYEGVGHAKNVHETWYAPSLYSSAIHLTKDFYYEHRKSVMKIYRNATRNFFIGGSGDNLGDLNPTYVELHQITKQLGIDTWKQFEETLKVGNTYPEIVDFLVRHRSDSKYGWESEVREMFKWYFEMHPEENTGDWKSEYTAPAAGSREEIENYVISTYFQVLGRSPDDMGKTHYVDAIIKGEIPREALPSIFINSDEYRMKFVSHLKDGIALCIMGYHDALPMIKESIETCGDYVKEIHVQGDFSNEEDIAELQEWGAEVHIEKWEGDFSAYKNKAISFARTKWVLILDHDEIPTSELAQHLPELIEQSEKGNKYNMVSFTARNETINTEGLVIASNDGNGKALLHFNIKDPYYGNPHIWLKPNYYPWVEQRVPYAYRHVKQEGIEQERAVRNVWMGGGGDNFREKNPLWPELRQITDRLGITDYKEMLKYLKTEPKIDTELDTWIKKAYDFPWHDSELKEFKQLREKYFQGKE